MATMLYKWSFAPLFYLALLAGGNASLHKPAAKPHPVHIATVEIEHNAADKTLEITCKTFWDDFESILSKINKTRVDLASEKSIAENNPRVYNYMKSHLQINIDGKAMQLSFVGYEKEDVVIYSYLQADSVASVKQVNVTSSIMHDMFDDQTEIIHVIVNGKRQSTKLDYPATKASFIF
jgi:hypothetical protein